MSASEKHSARETVSVGLDVGSISVKGLVVDAAGQVCGRSLQPLAGDLGEAVQQALADLMPAVAGRLVRLGITGQGRHAVGQVPGAVVENEVLCLLAAAGALGTPARAVIEIGGQIARCIGLEPRPDGELPSLAAFALNDQCAAGAGAFLTQQAGRLKMEVGAFAAAAAAAPKGASIAGRCAVFAKSDMIHLQQKGVGVEDIAYGLCLALARNFLATVLKGRVPAAPVALAGGGALNAGLVRAFRDVLGLAADELTVLPEPLYVGARGAAALAAKAAPGPFARVREQLALRRPAAPRAPRPEPVLHARRAGVARPALPCAPAAGPIEAFLGVDVGSVSTDLALVGRDGTVLDGVYLPTRGRPIDVLREGLGLLAARYGERLRVVGLGTTGSGRHLAGRLLGADIVKNEITAQLKGALHYFPDADCIFEIGGQDSKYIRIERGRLADFTMNKVCAAGTGSFLEEQCENLGIDVKTDFAGLAAESHAPADLGSRCTVFMETELVNARRSGAGLPDLCAGLALAVARNYLTKVVAQSAVGAHVVFQGGVAGNAAVVAAFEELLGQPVGVHPHSGLSGAIGIALLARDAGVTRTAFKGLGAVAEHHESKTFECRQCENRCEVSVVRVGEQRAHFGDTCERYTVRDAGHGASAPKVPDLFAEREALLMSFLSPAGAEGRSVGLPRSSMLLEYLPFWSTLLQDLGLRVVVSPPSSSSILELGSRHLPAETCLPIKITFGHVAALQEMGVDHILVPSVVTVDDPTRKTAQVCPFTSAAPFMARAAVNDRILTPAFVLGKGYRFFAEEMLPFAAALGFDPARLEAAYEHAVAAQTTFRDALRRRGEELLAGDFAHALVVVGRPYNLGDHFLNLNLARHLVRLGVLAFPQGFLPADQTDLGEHDVVPWRFPRDAMRAALLAGRDPRLHPVLVTNFGCGLDAFVGKYLTHTLGERAPLVLEFDEHRGEAGMVTRIEAYLDRVRGAAAKPIEGPRPKDTTPALRVGDGTIYIPYFADHSYALDGALRFMGADTEVLPPPDDRSTALGEEASTGKECHAYSMIGGDLLRLAARLDPRERATFLIFGTTAPCLLTQFGDGLRLALRERGIENIRVASPQGSTAILQLLGLRGVSHMWRGLVAVDYMTRWLCETRPYELTPGRADEVHRENLRDLADSLAKGESLGWLDRAAQRMRGVAIDRSHPRPLIGVAGDIYTRINPVANQDLFRTLEAMGCEVWPCSLFVDTTDFGFSNAVVRGMREHNYPEAAVTYALGKRKDYETWRIRRKLGKLIRGPWEPSYRETMRMATPYVGPRSMEMLLLNVGKMVQFAEAGADGVLHAICLNCMVGTATAGLLERIRHDHGVPVVNLVYATSETPAPRTRREAFVHPAQ
ncbi:MAG TPA: acyl-CoA dehydratase activase, partial [Polyangia bacterium]